MLAAYATGSNSNEDIVQMDIKLEQSYSYYDLAYYIFESKTERKLTAHKDVSAKNVLKKSKFRA